MAQPPPYDRSYNFHDYQAENPLKPLPADRLDEEFSRIKTTIDAVLQNLALIQRDDTALANKSVGFDQLKDELDGFGFNPPTEWEPEKNYIVRDTVFYDTRFYRCLESHVSSADFEADLNAGLWDMVADFTIVQTTAIAARDAALQAQADAEAAQQAAEDARDDALLAQSGAESARDAAIGAKDDALLAKSGAESARDASVVAKGLAEAAQAGAEQAQADAEAARDDAISARNAAQSAQTGAENAADRAVQAASDVEHPVSYAPQTLDPSEQAQARANLGLGSAATEDSSAFATAAQGAAADTALQPTITTTVTFNLPLSTSTQLINLQQGYGIYSDNTGMGSDNSRLWFAGPDGGEVLVGPRSGSAFLHQIRLRANTTRIEGNCLVTGSLTLNGSVSYHRGNILGTVSQSGGTPTGAIIERGSNANGQYVRYADGTQICHFHGTVTNQAINNAYGSSGLFIGERTWTFPAQFASGHIVAFHQGRWASGGSWSSLAEVTTTTAAFRFIDAVSRSTGTDFVLNFVAIGRWF